MLCKVSGDELLRESMIKLPINVENSGQTSWKNCLAEAKDQRDKLAEKALAYYRDGHRLIRPIVLVQVERTGKDQREPQYIHAEDVREFLTTRMGIPAEAVKVKSSETDDIEGIDLMADDCPVEWIITKSALQEGWGLPVRLHPRVAEQHAEQAGDDATGRSGVAAAVRDEDAVPGTQRVLRLLPPRGRRRRRDRNPPRSPEGGLRGRRGERPGRERGR